MTKIDENGEYETLAWDGTNPVPLRVDPVTGELLVMLAVEAVPHVGATGTVDENGEYVALAYDGTNPAPLLVNPANNYLLIEAS